MGDLLINPSTKLGIVAFYAGIVLFGTAAGHFGWFGTEGVHYFAQRRNILNAFYVKQGWTWFSLAFAAAVVARQKRNSSTVKHSVARYVAATAWWVLFAQWFFGPPIMDRLFTATGGQCAVEWDHGKVVSSKVCRSYGGSWEGGHDPSGHVFLLCLSSIVLAFESVPLASTSATARNTASVKRTWLDGFVAAILILNSVMLLLTCVYFHSGAEKMSGYLFALAEVYAVYFRGTTAPWGRFFGTDASPNISLNSPNARTNTASPISSARPLSSADQSSPSNSNEFVHTATVNVVKNEDGSLVSAEIEEEFDTL